VSGWWVGLGALGAKANVLQSVGLVRLVAALLIFAEALVCLFIRSSVQFCTVAGLG